MPTVDHDLVGVDLDDLAGSPGDDDVAGIDRGPELHAGADVGSLGRQQRHSLALHVRAHQGAVGVVVLEERDERRRDRHELRRVDVHVVDLVGRYRHDLVAAARPRQDLVVQELAGLGVERRVRLGDRDRALVLGLGVDDGGLFFGGVEVDDLRR